MTIQAHSVQLHSLAGMRSSSYIDLFKRSGSPVSVINDEHHTVDFPLVNWEKIRIPLETHVSPLEIKKRDLLFSQRLFGVKINAPYYLDHRSDKRILTLADDMDLDVYYRISRVLLKRFHQNTNYGLNSDKYLPALRLMALAITIKTVCDLCVWNSDFIQNFDIRIIGTGKKMKVENFNMLEEIFLKTIKYETDVEISEMHPELTESDLSEETSSWGR